MTTKVIELDLNDTDDLKKAMKVQRMEGWRAGAHAAYTTCKALVDGNERKEYLLKGMDETVDEFVIKQIKLIIKGKDKTNLSEKELQKEKKDLLDTLKKLIKE